MKWLQLIFFLTLALVVATDSSESSEENNEVTKLMFQLGWEADKGAIMDSLLNELSSENVNITLVAWQDIHDEKGNLDEIRTLELVIPAKEDAKEDDAYIDFDVDDFDDLVLEIEDAQYVQNESLATGLDSTLSKELYDDEGGEYYQVVLVGDKILYASTAGSYSFYNETIPNATPEQINAFIRSNNQQHSMDAAVLKYDSDGNFEPSESHIVTPVLVAVSSIQDAPVEVVDKVATVAGEVAAKHPDGDISNQLYEGLESQIPEYLWDVFESPSDYYVTRDFGIFVRYDPLELGYRSEYYIYAVKK